MAAGDFTLSEMPDVLIKIDELFADPRNKRELEHPLESAKSVLENQMVSFLPVMVGNKCVGIKAAWLKSCNETVDTCANTALADCDIGGVQIESDQKDFTVNNCLRNSFAVYDDQCKDKFDVAEKMAYAFAVKTLEIEKMLNNTIISYLSAQATANLYTGTYGSIVATQTGFDADQYVPDLLAEMDITADFNDIRNPILLSGTLLKNAVYNAGFNNLNDDQKDQIAKFNAWNLYFDPRNIDTTQGEPTMFMFDAGSLAFFSKNEFDNLAPMNMMDGSNTHVFRMPSRRLQYRDGNAMKPVTFDVYTQKKCTVTASGVRRWGTHVEIILNFGLHVGPLDCNDGSGILEFVVNPIV